MKASKVKFNADGLKKVLTKNLVELQTQNFIDYAQDKIRLLGDAIQLYHSAHHMDRTGNLLNSLCWGVAYSGKLMGSGFYRDARTHAYKSSSWEMESDSYLHEFFKQKEAYRVDGRWLADKFIKAQGRASAQGYWRVWFAILAPYWGYWEKGFTMKSHFGHKTQRLQFAVMSEWHDKVEEELKPAKVKIDVFVPQYSPQSLKYQFNKYQRKGGSQYSKRDR